MPGENRILPVLDRRTPLLDRIREDNDGDDVGAELGIIVADAVKSDDSEFFEEVNKSLSTSIRDSLAANLDVDPDNIRDEFANELADHITGVSESDVLTEETLEQFGITDEDSSDDDDDTDEEDDGELF